MNLHQVQEHSRGGREATRPYIGPVLYGNKYMQVNTLLPNTTCKNVEYCSNSTFTTLSLESAIMPISPVVLTGVVFSPPFPLFGRPEFDRSLFGSCNAEVVLKGNLDNTVEH